MDINVILYVLAALTGLSTAQSYRYNMYRGRRTRPASRLFGSSVSSSRSRYDPGSSRRPASRPFTIPGFSSSFNTPSSNNFQNNLGFNLGFGGRAFSDPIAGFYDQPNSVGDGGGMGQGLSAGFNDRVNQFASFNPAANTRSSMVRESKTAIDPSVYNSRQQDMGTREIYLSAGGLGLGFTNQDSNQFLTQRNSGGFATQDLTSNNAANQALGVSNFRSQLGQTAPTQNPLNNNQLNGLGGSVQFIDATGLGNGGITSLDLANLAASNRGLQQSMNRLDMSGGSGLVDHNNLLTGHEHTIVTGHQQHKGFAAQLGIDTNQLGIGSNQLGLGSKQLDLSQNKLLLDANSLGLGGNHVIIQSEQMELPNMSQGSLSSENQVMLGSSNDQMNLLGNQLGLGNGQQLLTNQINSDLGHLTAGHLNSGSSLQGQGQRSDGELSSQIITLTGEFPGGSLSSQTLTSQGGLGSANQFYTPKGDVQILSQSQNAGQMTSQLNNAMLINQGA